jgi:DNA adenine methylase
MKSPFPYFGGKAKVASDVWDALGQPRHYIEPFFGGGAVLLLRPDWEPAMVETVNDKDGFVANVWRALQASPDEVARWCDWPVSHADLCARKKKLIKNENHLLENLIKDDEFFDAKLAGYWIWAASCWIGSGLTRPNQIPHLSDAGMGVHAIGKRPHLSDAGMGVQEPYRDHLFTWFRELS